MTTYAYKCLTHDLCSPVQGGAPIWDGSLPFQLPSVRVDTSRNICSYGWNAAEEISQALNNGGFWPNGYPTRVFSVNTDSSVVRRAGGILRASTWTIEREVTTGEINKIISKMSSFLDERVVAEQIAWRNALARPKYDANKIEYWLKVALEARELCWNLEKLDSAQIKSIDLFYNNLLSPWYAAMPVDHEFIISWFTWNAEPAWISRFSPHRAATCGAFDAQRALTRYRAALKNGLPDPLRLSIGIREAYEHGLTFAVPMEPATLAWF